MTIFSTLQPSRASELNVPASIEIAISGLSFHFENFQGVKMFG